MNVFLLNTPEDNDKLICRDMAGGLGFERSAKTVLPPLDLLQYASTLRNHSNNVLFYDSQTENDSIENIIKKILLFSADIIIATISLPSLDWDIEIVKNIRKALPADSKVIVKTGIKEDSILNDILIRTNCYLCIHGECDFIISDIIASNNFSGTARLIEGNYVSERELLREDLDNIPMPARDLVDASSYCYPRLGNSITTMQTSRGCPFACSYYCPYPLVQGKKWRAMTAKRVLEELKYISEVNGINKVFFRDATFTLDKKRVVSICKGILAENLYLKWWCESRANCLDKDLLIDMRRAGCCGINLGVETGDEGLLQTQAKQGVSVKVIKQISEYCKEIGLKLHFLLMVGLPGETRQSLKKTIMLVDTLKPESLGVTIATPYPGTQLYADALKNGWGKDFLYQKMGGHNFSINLPFINQGDLELAIKKIHELCRINNQEDRNARKEIISIFKNW